MPTCLRFAPLLLTLLLLAGCKNTEETAGNQSSAAVTVRATNRNFKAIEIYAISEARRALLGRISAGTTRTYTLPNDFIRDASTVQFQLESVDRTINILTDRVLAVPGEEIILVIPNEH